MTFKRFLSVVLSVAMVLGLSTGLAFAEWSGGPTVSLTASELDGNKVDLTITVSATSDEDYVKGYSLGVVYDPELVEPDTSAGTYKYQRKSCGITFSSPDPDFNTYNTNVNPKADAVDDDGNTFFMVVAANAEGITNQGFSITYHFTVKDTTLASGGVVEFSIANGVSGGDTPSFNIDGSDGKTVPYPEENNTVTVAIPITAITVTGDVTTPAKGVEDQTALETSTEAATVTYSWDPELTANEAGAGTFASNTVYTVTITVAPADGAAFDPDCTVTYEGHDEYEFEKQSDGTYVATKTFPQTADKTLVRIAVTTQPDTTEYVDGDAFDPAGMVVTAYYDEGDPEEYTNYSIDPEILTKGDTSVSIISNDNEKLGDSVNVTVAGKPVTAADFTVENVTAEYTGEDLSDTLSRMVGTDNFDGKVNFLFYPDTVVEVGQYIIFANVNGDTHYEDMGDTFIEIGTAHVTPKTLTVTVDDIADQVYTASQITPEVTVNAEITLTEDDYTVSYGENVNVGTGTVTVTAAEGKNYTFTAVTKEFNITPATVTLEWPSANSFTYNGKEWTYEAAVRGMLGSDTVTVTYEGSTATDVGEYTSTATGISNSNYQLPADNLSHAWSITKANYGFLGLTYDVTVSVNGGDKTVTLAEMNLPAELVDAEIAHVDFTGGDITISNIQIASDKQSVTFTCAPAEADDTSIITLIISNKNYNDVNAQVRVTAKALEIPDSVWDNVSVENEVEYGTTNAQAVTLNNTQVTIQDIEGNDVTGTLEVLEPDTVQNVGTATAAVRFTVNDGQYAGVTADHDVTYTVTAKEVAVTWADTELTYTGEDQKPTATAEGVNGETLTLTVSGEQTDAGDYEASAALTAVTGGNASVDNYTLTGNTAAFTIAPAEVTGTVAISADDPAVEGTVLSVETDDVPEDAALTYQWKRNGEDIEGANGATYTATAEDVGAEITVVATAEGNYTGTLTSEGVTVKGAPAIESFTASGTSSGFNAKWTVKDNGSTVTGYTLTITREGEEDRIVEVAADQTGASVGDLTRGNTYTVTLTVHYTLGETEGDVDSDPIQVKVTLSSGYYVGPSAPTPEIVVEDDEHGDTTITPAKPKAGDTVTIETDPDEGYVPGDVTVTDENGNEIPVTEKDKGVYTFEMPKGKVTVHVEYVEETPEVPAFEDVDPNAYYADGVKWAVKNGVTNGTSATTFSPDASCTRAQAVTFLWRAAGSPEPETADMPFEDVDPNAYYAKAVLWAAENGITKGTGDGSTFSPDMEVTRGQMVTFLYRMMKGEADTSDMPFTDVDPNAYYAEAVLWAVANGITNGTSETTFSPEAVCSRGQTVTFLSRALQ